MAMEFLKHHMVLFIIWFLHALVSLSHGQGFVREVKQNYEAKLNSQVEQQVQSFHNQELAYRSYASFFGRADVNLPGFKKHFQSLGRRALDNALSMTTLINDRGGRIRFPVVKLQDACKYMEDAYDTQEVTDRTKPHWKVTSGLQGLEDALALEKSINAGLLQLVNVAKSHGDPHIRFHIEEYLDEQVKTIKKLVDFVTKLRQFGQDDYSLGEFLLDKDLQS